MNNNLVLESLKLNCKIVLDLLDEKKLEDLLEVHKYSNHRKEDTIELTLRMKQLRKDTIKLDKLIYPKEVY